MFRQNATQGKIFNARESPKSVSQVAEGTKESAHACLRRHAIRKIKLYELIVVVHLLEPPAVDLVGPKGWANSQILALLGLFAPDHLIGCCIVFIVTVQLCLDDLTPQEVLQGCKRE